MSAFSEVTDMADSAQPPFGPVESSQAHPPLGPVERKLGEKGNAAPEPGASGPRSLVVKLKRRAEDNLRCTEKKRKVKESDQPQKDCARDPGEIDQDPDAGEAVSIELPNYADLEDKIPSQTKDQQVDHRFLHPERAMANKAASPDSSMQKTNRDAPEQVSLEPEQVLAAAGPKRKSTKRERAKKPEADSDEDCHDGTPTPGSKADVGNAIVDLSSDSDTHASIKSRQTTKQAGAGTKAKNAARSAKHEHLQKSTPKKEAAPPSEAARSADVVRHEREEPRTVSTQLQAEPADIIVLCDKSYVEKQMGSIQDAMTKAMLAFFQEEHIDPQALPRLEPTPEPELEALYKSQWGDRWQKVFTGLASRKKPGFLRQKTTFLGLLGSGIRTMVFVVLQPWDMKTRLGVNYTYLEQAMTDLGHELGDVMKYVKARQIADPRFQKQKVVPLARSLAGALALILSPHVKQMSRRGKLAKADIVEYDCWITYLEEAFRTAIILKHTLQSSNLGPFVQDWPQFEVGGFEVKWHRAYYERKNAAHIETDIIHAILPGVYKKARGVRVVFSHTLLVAE